MHEYLREFILRIMKVRICKIYSLIETIILVSMCGLIDKANNTECYQYSTIRNHEMLSPFFNLSEIKTYVLVCLENLKSILAGLMNIRVK